jgi:ribosomal protein L37AE/L43A
VNRRDRKLVRDIVTPAGPRKRKRRTVRCLKCGRPTTRLLDNSIGICPECEGGAR